MLFLEKRSYVVKKNKKLDTLLEDFGVTINLDCFVCQITQQLFFNNQIYYMFSFKVIIVYFLMKLCIFLSL